VADCARVRSGPREPRRSATGGRCGPRIGRSCCLPLVHRDPAAWATRHGVDPDVPAWAVGWPKPDAYRTGHRSASVVSSRQSVVLGGSSTATRGWRPGLPARVDERLTLMPRVELTLSPRTPAMAAASARRAFGDEV